MGVDVAFTTRDLRVDVQSYVQGPNAESPSEVQDQHDSGPLSSCHLWIGSIWSCGNFDAQGARSARSALGRGAQLRRAAELELALKGGVKADPQVTLDLYTIRAWQRELCSEGKSCLLPRSIGNLPPRVAEGEGQSGTSTLSICQRLHWQPEAEGFSTPRGSIRWEDAGYFVVLASHCQEESMCSFCQEEVGTPQHVLFDCPAFTKQRKEAKAGTFREDIPACVQTYGLGIQFPQPLQTTVEVSAGTTTDDLLFTDGSGKHPAEPSHRKCGCGISGETTKLSYPVLAVRL
eukprot:4771293-Amphidinium_carterae.2